MREEDEEKSQLVFFNSFHDFVKRRYPDGYSRVYSILIPLRRKVPSINYLSSSIETQKPDKQRNAFNSDANNLLAPSHQNFCSFYSCLWGTFKLSMRYMNNSRALGNNLVITYFEKKKG